MMSADAAMDRRPWWPLSALAGIVLLAAVIRFSLASQSMWFDEFASFFFASQPFSKLWSVWMVRETNPPLFYSVLRGWMLLAGPMDRVWLRVPSIMASLAVIPVLYWGIARTYDAKAALIASLLLALSAQQITYALQIRGYSLQGLALCVSFVGLLAIVRAHERDALAGFFAWGLYTGGALAAIYSHTTSLLWPAIASFAVFVVDRRSRTVFSAEMRSLLIANFVIAVGASWWLYITYLQITSPNGNIVWLGHGSLWWAKEIFRSSIFLVRSPDGWEKIIPVLMFAAATFGAVRTWRLAATRLTVMCFVTSVAVYLLASQKQWILIERSVVWMAIFPLTLIAAGLGTIRYKPVFATVSGVFVALLTWNAYAKSGTYEWERWNEPIATLIHDPKAVLIVDDEGMAVAAAAACAIDLQRSLSCPFPIVTVSRPGQAFNGWAQGYAPRPVTAADGGWVAPTRTNIYVIQRFNGTTQSDFAAAGLLGPVKAQQGFFLGPYPAPPADVIRRRLHLKDGVFWFVPEGTRADPVSGTAAR